MKSVQTGNVPLVITQIRVMYNLQGSQQDKVKFQDQLLTKFQDIFRPQAAKYTY